MSMAVFIIRSVRMVIQIRKWLSNKEYTNGGRKETKACVITLFVICLELVNDNSLEV